MTTTQAHFGANLAGGNHQSLGATFETFRATEVTDLATLVADGASPTQAHVNTVNADHTNTLLGINTCDFNVIFDTTKITTLDQYRQMAAKALAYFSSILKGP